MLWWHIRTKQQSRTVSKTGELGHNLRIATTTQNQQAASHGDIFVHVTMPADISTLLRASTTTAAQHQQYIECQHHCSNRMWVCNGATGAPMVDAIGRCVDDAVTAATTGDWHDGTRNCFCRSSCRGSLLANTICSVAAQSGNSCASE